MARRKSNLTAQQLILPAVVILLLIYIFGHLFTGQRGLFTWHQLNQQVRELKHENALQAAEIDELERELKRFDEQNPDLDYIEEVIRQQKAVARPGEEILLLPKNSSAAPAK